MSYRHIVLTRLHDDADDAARTRVVQVLAELANEPGIVYWNVNESVDTRKGHIVVTDAEFTDEAAFQAFRVSAAHVKAGEFIREVADWWVGDYLED